MCQEIKEYRWQNQKEFSNYFDLKKIDADAEDLLNKINESHGISSENDMTNIIQIAKEIGFNIFYAKLKGENSKVSGMIGVSKELKDKFKSDKVIILNSTESDEHMLFTIAHELAHYIYDYNSENTEYFNKYNTEECQTDEEIRANRFAASIMMPKSKFEKVYDSTKNMSENIKNLSVKFRMPETAVSRRIMELGLR